MKDTHQVRTRGERDKLVMASKMDKPEETKKGERIADDDESEQKPHTEKPKTPKQSEQELHEAEKQAYQLADPKNEESGLASLSNPKDTRFHTECAPPIYNVDKHTYKIDHLLHIYISEQNDIILVGIKYFFANAPSRILKPGKKGIYLTVDQYRTLIDMKGSISKAIEQIKKDTDGKGWIEMEETKLTEKDKPVAAKPCFVISKEKKAMVESKLIFEMQQVVVDIRDYSTPSELSRAKLIRIDYMDKAVVLTVEQWNTLLSLHSTVIKDLADNFGCSEDFADELSA